VNDQQSGRPHIPGVTRHLRSPAVARYPAPVEIGLWAALLVGTAVEVPCHFASALSWRCGLRDDYGKPCPVLPDHATDDQRARHLAETDTGSIACFGTSVAIADLVAYYGDYIPVCLAHAAWLELHGWIDGMTSGFLLTRVPAGRAYCAYGAPYGWVTRHVPPSPRLPDFAFATWRFFGWSSGDAPDGAAGAPMPDVTVPEPRDDDTSRWHHRMMVPWRAVLVMLSHIDPADRLAVAAASASPPQGVPHSRWWLDQLRAEYDTNVET
jgi:hypothetical protein